MPQTPIDLLHRMRTAHPASPRLVRHGAEGRIELSGRVFDNWVAKTSNLLVDELDAVEGTSVRLDLPVHWKSLAIAFACWQVGAVVVLPAGSDAADVTGGTGDPTDIVVTSGDLAPVSPPRLMVCVALGSLAARWDGPLPRGAVDFAAEVRSHGDVFLGASDQGADQVLVRTGDRELTAADLRRLVHAAPAQGADGDGASGPPEGSPQTFLLAKDSTLVQALAAAVVAWSQDGTLVLVEEDLGTTASMLAGERVTARLEPS